MIGGGGVKFFGAGHIQVRIVSPDFCYFPRPIRIRSPYRTFIELKSNFLSDFLKHRYATYRDQLLKLKQKNRRMNFQQSDLFKILDDMKQRKFLRS